MFFSHDRAGGMRFFGCFALFCGAVVFTFAVIEFQRDRDLRSRGETASAVVVGRDTETEDSDGNRITKYRIRARYRAGSRQVEREFPVSSAMYSVHPTGSQIELVFDPGDPASARLSEDLRSGAGYLLPGGLGVALLTVGLGFLIAANIVKARDQSEADVPSLEEALARARLKR
ncbi:MAG TPA: DUF3592 domain-containing protein [Fimbriimonadales bacterium]|nr:DUF3592 domain-containing protein [Fimbriimonadales bacterium]